MRILTAGSKFRTFGVVAVIAVLLGCAFAHAWTDPTITSNSTSVRKVHVDELRSTNSPKNIANQRTQYGFGAYSYTDPTITANSTMVRVVHITQMRDAIDDIEFYFPACITAPPGADWTDPTITANSTKIRGVHITELRTAVDSTPADCGACSSVTTCKKCAGTSGIINQTSSEDLWNDCTAGGCLTGNCNNNGACGTVC